MFTQFGRILSFGWLLLAMVMFVVHLSTPHHHSICGSVSGCAHTQHNCHYDSTISEAHHSHHHDKCIITHDILSQESEVSIKYIPTYIAYILYNVATHSIESNLVIHQSSPVDLPLMMGIVRQTTFRGPPVLV